MLKRELINENRTRIIFVIMTFFVLLIGVIGVQGFVSVETKKNNQRISTELKKITYTENKAKQELDTLKPFAKKSMVSVAAKGKLYRSMAELSYMMGDEMLYNEYVADALFYLEQAKDVDAIVYISNKYIGRLYANGCYNSAQKVLDDLAKKTKISNLSVEMQASYYLSCTDVRQMQGKDGTFYLQKAYAATELMEQGGNKKLNFAKYDLLTARSEIQKKHFSKAESIISKYARDDNFGLGNNQVYVVCDFEIPYCEIMAKIQLHKKSFDSANENINTYLMFCDKYQFRSMKLHLLQYVVKNIPSDKSQQLDNYRRLEKTVSDENLIKMTDEYGQFLLADIDNTTQDLKEKQKAEEETKRNAIIALMIVYGLILLYCVISIVIDSINKDGLTKLNSRKQFDKMRNHCEKRKIPFCFLLIDIDDFKKVNDTFGHATGDMVLQSIGEILRNYTGRGIYAYRYGGEELCMFFLRVPEKRVRTIANEIREKIEADVSTDEMHITVSGGVSVSLHGENVFQEADQKLYESKRKGKNQIR